LGRKLPYLLSFSPSTIHIRNRWMNVGSSPGRDWEFFSLPPCPNQLWCPPSLLSSGYQGLFPWGVKLTTDLQLVPRSKKCGALPSFPHYALMAWCSVKSTGITLPFTLRLIYGNYLTHIKPNRNLSTNSEFLVYILTTRIPGIHIYERNS
jgi:hypothetical protein